MSAATQIAFDELAPSLHDITFVVVDLETTGGSPADCAITEIGAVKVRGGETLGELQTLVNPQTSIPPFVAVLTGITDAMVAAAPAVGAVLPTFLEFARGAVLVAHNAPFDVGFLRAAAARLELPWPGFEVLDTARLARRVLTRDETPDCRLATLARLFRSEVTPCHRALADARATVSVLHGLFERLGNLGVRTMGDLRDVVSAVTPEQRRKRHLADPLPRGPGVYVFRDAADRVLYVGKSRDVRSRVRRYFSASEPRARMVEMVGLAERVDAIPCAHELEAEVRELRLIAEHRPRYNRRSKFPERSWYVILTQEPFPRLSIVRRPAGQSLGPFGSRRAAELTVEAVQDAFRIRRCTTRLSRRRTRPACVLAELGRCVTPCDGTAGVEEYAAVADAVRRCLFADPDPLFAAAQQRLAALTERQRYEQAAAVRERTATFARAVHRYRRLASLVGCPALVAARPRPAGGWELTAVRSGRFVGSVCVPSGAPVSPYAAALLATGPAPTDAAALPEETECILRWLAGPGVRLVSLTGTWCSPAVGGAGVDRWRGVTPAAGLDPFADRRSLRPALRFVPIRPVHEARQPRRATPTGVQPVAVRYE